MISDTECSCSILWTGFRIICSNSLVLICSDRSVILTNFIANPLKSRLLHVCFLVTHLDIICSISILELHFHTTNRCELGSRTVLFYIYCLFQHCKNSPRSSIVIELFTPVVQRILKHKTVSITKWSLRGRVFDACSQVTRKSRSLLF